MADDITTIQLHESTKKKLEGLGKKSDTFEDILLMLIKEFVEARK